MARVALTSHSRGAHAPLPAKSAVERPFDGSNESRSSLICKGASDSVFCTYRTGKAIPSSPLSLSFVIQAGHHLSTQSLA